MTSKGRSPTVADAPKLSSATTRFAVVLMPDYLDFLRVELPGVIAELACPESICAAIDAALTSAEAGRVIKAKYSELLEAYPERLRGRILSAFGEPFNLNTAHSLRALFELEGNEARERCAAVAVMALRLGILPIKGHQLKSYVRAAWLVPGVTAHPVALHIPCPNCAQDAIAFVALPLPSNLRPPDWRIKCTHCDYEDCKSSDPGIREDDAIRPEEEIRLWIERSPAVTGHWSASKARRDSFLKSLRACWRNSGPLLEQLRARAVELREHWLNSDTVADWLTYDYIHTTLYENLAQGIPLKRQSSSHRGYAQLQTDADRLLENIPKAQILMSLVAWPHPAPHWRDEFDAARAHIDEALEEADAIEAAIQTALFLRMCLKNGLALPVVLDVALPEELRPAPLVPPVSKPSDRLRDVSIADLAAFLAKSLSTSGVVIQPEAIARQLHRFQKFRQKE